MPRIHTKLFTCLLAAQSAVTYGKSEVTHGRSLTLDEVIVTARKFEESLQDSPLSVTAYSSKQLEEANIRSMSDLANATPGLMFDAQTAGTASAPIIRGLTQLNTGGFDIQASNNVGRFVDGVYQSNRQSAETELLDIARVEVIKGPASAFYGRSTFAGAINLVTQLPTKEFEAEVMGGVGSDEDVTGSVMVSGPIKDTMSARIKIGHRSFDGTFDNNASSDNLQGYEQTLVSGSLLWESGANWVNTFRGFYSDREDDHSAQYTTTDANCGDMQDGRGNRYYCGEAAYVDDITISPDAVGAATKTWQLSLTSEYELDWGIFTGILSASEVEVDGIFDQDFTATGVPHNVFSPVVPVAALFPPGTPLPALPDALMQTGLMPDGTVLANAYSSVASDNEDRSMEFRITSNDHDSLEWMLGAFWFESESVFAANYGVDNALLGENQSFFSILDSTATALPGLASTDRPTDNNLVTDFDSDVETISVFGRLGYDINDSLNASFDLRWEKEEKTLNNLLNNGMPGTGEKSDTWEYVTPRISLTYHLNHAVMVYANAAKGVRSGGINAAASNAYPEDISYEEESNWSYEVGTKTSWFDNHLKFNVAAFYIDWEDIQIAGLSQTPGALGQILRNVGGATSKGIDLRLDSLPASWLRIGVGYAYTDATFKNGSYNLGARAQCGFDNCSLVDSGLSDYTGSPILIPDISGNQLPKSPKHQLNADVTVHGSFENWDWSARLDYQYRDDYFLDTINQLGVGSRELVNLNFALDNHDWTLSLWAKNLFDEEYVNSSAFQPRSYTGTDYTFDFIQGEGRRFGATVTYRF